MDDQEALSSLDSPPVNGLEGIFVLPEDIAEDTRILGWYDEMTMQLRREAQGVPMSAAQYSLMERISFTYAKMRHEEFNNPNLTSRDRQALQDSWQKMLDQFNRLLEKHNDHVLQELLVKVYNIVNDGLPLISDEKERANLRRHYQAEFAGINL